MMHGIINVLKPPSMTSHDVVAYLRRLLGTKTIGHTGTLDPGVAGVLPLCVGNATRVAEFLTEAGKAYRAEITFGISTATQDSFGEVTGVQSVKFSYAEALVSAREFAGWIQQIPPMVSAVKSGGKRLYELAREGKEVERAARAAFIEELRPVSHKWEQEYPSIMFDVSCSKGTYVRTVCADWGAKLGCGAHLSYLIRTRSGPFALDQAYTLEELALSVEAGKQDFLQAPDSGLTHMPALVLKEHRVAALMNGLSLGPRDYEYLPGPKEKEGWARLYSTQGEFLALGIQEPSGHVKPKKVFPR
jgi:tRNA pseudouridine55 synthase